MTTATLAPGSRHEIRIRAPRIDYDDVPAHWLADNAIATQIFNGLNLVFPDGERFFIDSVRDHLDDIEDPKLRDQVRGFFGQEGRHAHEHERYFEAMEAQGYEIRPFLRRFERFTKWTTRWLPRGLRLAMTAGAEHYTATLGAMAFENPLLDRAHPAMRRLAIWHATEEVEHKAVAFDVLQATHPSYALRILGFVLATLEVLAWSGAGTRMLLRQDRDAGRVDAQGLAAAREELQELHKWQARRLKAAMRAYLRRDFHPNDTDELALAHEKLVEVGLQATA
ncbi:MAG: metal-dependent hydrolase [Myxococcota bacterium]